MKACLDFLDGKCDLIFVVCMQLKYVYIMKIVYFALEHAADQIFCCFFLFLEKIKQPLG